MTKMNILVMLLIAGFALRSEAQAPSPQGAPVNTNPVNVVLADGTSVKLRLGSATASTAVRIGESLELEVAEDVRVSDVVIIAKGSAANAEVTNLRSGGTARGGWIDINLESVTLADGRKVPIRASKNKVIRDQTTIISNSGQDASITQGTDLTAYIDGNQPVDLTRMRAASGPTTEVKVSSTPSNAEISVDGRLVGSTPYTLHVQSGEHIVVLRMVGFQPWQNKIHVAGQPVSLDVPMAKQDGTETTPASKPVQPSLGDLARAARARKPPSATTPITDINTDNQNGQHDATQPPPTPKQ